MINKIVTNLIRFIILVLVQVVILNNIQLNGYINPYMYILFIMLLPFETPGWLLLLLSFIIGLTVDMFSNTVGMHAAASVFLGFCRPKIISFISPREGYETESNPTLKDMGIRWFLSYTIMMVLIHHFVLFYTEAFRFKEFFETFLRVILSSSLTIMLIILSEYLFFRNKTPR
jgi:cell shape-determining protein MreD